MDRLKEQMDVARTERSRWEILRCADVGGHIGVSESVLLSVLSTAWAETTRSFVRDQLVYLEDRRLVRVERHEIKDWRVWLTRHGTDLVQYTIACEPGIDRPRKYWPGE